MRLLWLIFFVSPIIILSNGSPLQDPLPQPSPIPTTNILDDKNYLETIQLELEGKVSEAREEMIEKAKSIETVTRQYAKAKITQNLVKALRVLLEKEMKKIPMKVRIREPRQEEEDQEAGGQDEETSGSSGSSQGNQNQGSDNQESNANQNQGNDKEEGNVGGGGGGGTDSNRPLGNGNRERPTKNKGTSEIGGKTSTEDPNAPKSTTENPDAEATDSSGNEIGGSGAGEDEDIETTTGKVTLESTSLFGSIAAVLKTIVGGENGTKPLNLTHTLNYASDLILRPLGNFKPFQGVGSLLGLGPREPAETNKKPLKPKVQYIPVYITIPPITTEATTVTARKYPHRPLIGAFVGKSLWRSEDLNGTLQPEEQTTVLASTEKQLEETEAPGPDIASVPSETPSEPQPEASPAPTKSKQPVHLEIEEIFPVPEVTAEPPISSINYGLRNPSINRPGVPAKSDPFRPIGSVFAEPLPPTQATEPTTAEPEIIQTANPIPTVQQQAVYTPYPQIGTEQPSTQPSTQEPDIDSQEYEEFETEEPTEKPTPRTTTKKPKPVRTKPTTTTTTPKPQPGIIYIDNFAEDVQKGVDGLVKSLPDILKSAQQAIGLLQGLRGLFGGGRDEDDG